MNVDRMRQIDFWVGVPLCAVVSLVHRLWRLFRPEAPRSGRDILFIELSEMGSAVIADSAFKRAQTLFPEARLHFLIFAKNRPSLDIMGTIPAERTLTIRAESLVTLVIDTVRAIIAMRRLDLFAAIDMEMFSRYSALLTFFSGAANRVGFHPFHTEGLYRGDLLTHRVHYNPHQHVAKCFLAQIHALTEPAGTTPHTKIIFSDEDIRLERIVPPAAEIEAFRARIIEAHPVLATAPKWILLNPNSSELMPLRKWPAQRYIEVARRLLQDPEMAVLITGAPGERAEAQRLCDAVGGERMVNLAGFTRMTDLLPLYTLATLMLTNDSGPAHFAAPTGLKTIVLFGPETPKLYGALNPNAEFLFAGLACSPCVSAMNHRNTACDDARCMTAIPVDAVMERIADLLARP
ncbi:ADP-heptose synthase [Paramagnetospirillum marisnigri]|uniref:ADP-heptose synthase n=1 Tax=Paramagnetospirillum marisnigri TaxID=1285242 RepID=A0A178MRT5_9PROT|nr:glycosyltransferase family 9 protein [Paramagnetospirillum marisnigri]OAN52175.1 ADP-heptose synthase [Paramagnetospirillum marisnigri]